MKELLILILGFTMFCCGTEPSDEQIAEETNTTSPKIEAEKSAIEVTHPCKSVNPDIVLKVMGWEQIDEPASAEMSGYQSCRFIASGSANSINVFTSASTLSTIESKGLERSFQTDLERNDKNITYEEVEIGLGDQSLYQYGKVGPYNSYTLRWRKGNTVQYSVEFKSDEAQDKASVLNKLIQLAMTIE